MILSLPTFGLFISSVSPDTYAALEWPAEISPDNAYSLGILPVKAKLQDLIAVQSIELNRVRLSESDLLESSILTLPTFARLLEVHKRIVAFGERPIIIAWKILPLGWRMKLSRAATSLNSSTCQDGR
jgi:hypothetical protein